MATETEILRRDLRAAGLSNRVIEAAWPSWWSDDLADDRSGQAELRFALARRLGLSPRSLIGERVEFLWNNEALFKHLSVEDEGHRAALSSFGMTIGRLLLNAISGRSSIEGLDAGQLREAILKSRDFVDLQALLALCWGLGIPVVHLRVLPLATKSMQAMVVAIDGRHAILLGRDASYPAPIAFTLAHEIAHIALQHLDGRPALVDMEDLGTIHDPDDQEQAADKFALTLLTGRPNPQIKTSEPSFNAPSLAKAVLDAAPSYRIEPGTLALCVAHQRGAWPVAMAAMNFIYDKPHPVWREINGLADMELDWSAIGEESAQWVRTVMGAGG